MHGTVTLRAPELENPCLGTIRIEEEDRGLPLHLYSYLGTGDAWEVIASSKEFESQVPTARLSVAEVSSTTRLSVACCEYHRVWVCVADDSTTNSSMPTWPRKRACAHPRFDGGRPGAGM